MQNWRRITISELLINEQITFPEVRLIGEDGTQLGIMSSREALDKADEANLDLILIAPATANVIAKMAHGIADDALSTFYISHTGPTIVAPAMNPRMWAHPATQANVALLKERGVIFAGPDSGHVACGEEGTGRLCTIDAIIKQIKTSINI